MSNGKNNWHVITGGPGSGKTTTINLLKKRGYETTYEAARFYFESQLKLGASTKEIRNNPRKLQNEIFKLQEEIEASLSKVTHVFLDRAIPDALAYYEFYETAPPAFVKKKERNITYKTVFFLEELPMQKDEIRTESAETARKIANHIYKKYKSLNFNVIKVPSASMEKRVKFILKHIR